MWQGGSGIAASVLAAWVLMVGLASQSATAATTKGPANYAAQRGRPSPLPRDSDHAARRGHKHSSIGWSLVRTVPGAHFGLEASAFAANGGVWAAYDAGHYDAPKPMIVSLSPRGPGRARRVPTVLDAYTYVMALAPAGGHKGTVLLQTSTGSEIDSIEVSRQRPGSQAAVQGSHS